MGKWGAVQKCFKIFYIAEPGDRTAGELFGGGKFLIRTNSYKMRRKRFRPGVFGAGAAVIHRVPCVQAGEE
ncbi:hypothetical protein CA262_06215 [Sphingobium sp. GW456-12-10-14-TSB1]|nr:hypothetical protein [Sphingobium sp.]OUC54500.1 hypothetical protein CA262_06215 [Sphingobium sp. GW456-12-10-14-TSB1]